MPKNSIVRNEQTQSNATQNHTTHAQSDADAELARVRSANKIKRSGAHKPVRLHSLPVTHPQYDYADLLESGNDFAYGISLILELIERNTLERQFIEDADNPETENPPLFNDFNEGVLLRFAIVSSKCMGEKFGRALSRIDEGA